MNSPRPIPEAAVVDRNVSSGLAAVDRALDEVSSAWMQVGIVALVATLETLDAWLVGADALAGLPLANPASVH
jgi:hypothetical protein